MPLLTFSACVVTADNIFRSDYSCRNILRDADADKDGAIDRKEYLQLINDNSGQVFANVNSFDLLPLSLQANFLSLACLCEFHYDAEKDCCSGTNAHLLVPSPSDDNEKRDAWYFDEICRDTFETLAALTRSTSDGDESISSDHRARHRTHMPSPSPTLALPTASSDNLDIIIASAETSNVVKSSTTMSAITPWHRSNRHYFIPIITLTAFIILALGFSMYVTLLRQYQFRKRDKNGFILGSFPSVLPAASTLTDRNNWDEGGCFEARSLDEQDCGISFECSYDMSEVSSRISLRSIRVPSLWHVLPYSHYKPFVNEPMSEEGGRPGNISPMTSEHGSDRGSDIGSPTIQIHPFPGDHFTM